MHYRLAGGSPSRAHVIMCKDPGSRPGPPCRNACRRETSQQWGSVVLSFLIHTRSHSFILYLSIYIYSRGKDFFFLPMAIWLFITPFMYHTNFSTSDLALKKKKTPKFIRFQVPPTTVFTRSYQIIPWPVYNLWAKYSLHNLEERGENGD